MRLLRNRFFLRFLSVFFLLLFTHSLFAPYYALALTSGPHQPEFTSYEDAGSTDMVNLLTGDFTFNVPILDVPGPEGNFSLPLSYHAGIGLEQEASWVGLGWNINAGAIVRSINQYPDDASGEPNQIVVQDLSAITGWNRTFNHPFRDDWNSQTGYHGNINLADIVEVNFGSTTSVGIVGIHVGDGGVTFDPVQFATAVVNLVSWGVGSAATSAVSVAKRAAVEMAISTVSSFTSPINTPTVSSSGSWNYTNDTNVTVEAHHRAQLIHWAITSIPIPIFSKKKSYNIYLDQSRIEGMYGVLNLGKVNQHLLSTTDHQVIINNGQPTPLKYYPVSSTSTVGAASDMNFMLNGNRYHDTKTPHVLATDSYTVNAPGISGSISPYRLDIGSLSMPRRMDPFHLRFALLPYLDDYKVPFIYENTLSNHYLFHGGKAPTHYPLDDSSKPQSPSFNYGMDFSGTVVGGIPGIQNGVFTLTDYIFQQRVHPDFNSIKKIAQGNDIEWFSNEEIRPTDGTDKTPLHNFIDFLSADVGTGVDFKESDRYKFRSHYSIGTVPTPTLYFAYTSSFNYYVPVDNPTVLAQINIGSTLTLAFYDAANGHGGDYTVTITGKDTGGFSIENFEGLSHLENRPANISIPYIDPNTLQNPQLQKSIGGYSITAADGATYHFAIPVYDYDQEQQSISVNDDKKRSIIRRKAPFANTWLLTAITGPDFLDRNQNGMADDDDWGYWVKMNYGKYTDAFNWRIPYNGELINSSGTFKSFEKGTKQLYYLNSVETRSHVALFMKSTRADGKSASGGTIIYPMKLDEICLLKKEQYETLVQAPYNMQNFSNNVSAICESGTSNAIRDFIAANCVKRVKFSYGYDLCKNTINADGPDNAQKGKLTLQRISILGRNNLKVAPDLKFEYNTPNPNYHKDDWDGWGMYNGGGNSLYNSHQTSDESGMEGTSWSLSKIITPLGAEIDINYERDTYSSISGENVYDKMLTVNSPISNAGTGALNYIDIPTNIFLQDEKVRIIGIANYTCPDDGIPTSQAIPESIRTITSIQQLNGKYRLTFDQSFLTPQCSSNGPLPINITGTLARGAKKGGNIRVASIAMIDPNGRTNKQRYLYDETEMSSSGVVAQEPDYIKNRHYEFYDYLKYPQTPVMYSRVSVLSGRLTTDMDYDSKQVFEFETPHKSHLNYAAQDEGSIPSNATIEKILFKIEDRTAKVGKVKSIKLFDRTNKLVSESEFSYTDNIISENGEQYQGVYSEGTLLTDLAVDKIVFGQGTLKLNRTTVLTFPYTLKKIANKKDGFISTNENLQWDFITGSITSKLTKSSLGIYIKTVTQPAYKFYPELGPKSFGTSGVPTKNMLLQNAATYVYRSDAMGNALGLISADVQTWKKDWNNYRHLEGGNYEDEELPSSAEQVWRKGPAYVWKGDITLLQQAYGTQDFATSDEFNFTGPVNTNVWQYVGEMKRFDHYGMPLESVDKNGIHASVKMGYDNRTILASASNAQYNEIAFSSAEDKILDEPYFGGEVGLGAGQLVTNAVHTGNTALLLNANQTGFIFKTNGLTSGKRYRASVWTNNPEGKIYYKAGSNSSQVAPTEQTTSQPVAIPGMGNWYRVDLIIENPTPSITEIGVTTSSDGVVFDDFRFQPADAVMTCYVQQPLNFEFTIPPTQYSPSYAYSLDNDNLFTKVEANEKGEVVKVYAESIKYGVKLISESKSHYRRNTTDPQ